MGRLKKTIMVVGDGITEFYYFHSLQDCFKGMTIKPEYPKHTSIKELDDKIKLGIEKGYDYIFCVVDMDTKEHSTYRDLKKKYSKLKKGVSCEVKFFETHRCTELFFLYYFCYTSRPYENQESLLEDLNKNVEYRKTEEFFKKVRGLHSYFERCGGSLKTAIDNAEKSMKEKEESGREYTYSELGRLMKELEMLTLTQ